LFPDNSDQLRHALNSTWLILVSAVPGGGLSTSWQAILQATDRVTRDWVGIIDYDELETRVENIELNRFDSRNGQSPTDLMRSILLKQPEAFVVPKINDAATLDAMTHQVVREGRTVVTRMVAPSAAAGLLRLVQIAGKRRELIQAMTAVTCQRLARRLCDQCKQPMPASPELIKQLGADPAQPPTLYRQYTKPNPPPVDKKGRPIELKPCNMCAGLGYYGRVGLVELIIVDDAIRKALTQQPDLATITNLALNKRRQSALQQGYRHILAGTTSTAEIQRVFKESE
jgi:type II secretory ATPase GspE/PulE/Tfp pilus assembly ATPase PilB-like protein